MPATHRAIVIPADPRRWAYTIAWTDPTKLLDLLYKAIGCDCVDATRTIVTPLGTLVGWVDDVGLRTDPIQHNDRALILLRHLGYPAPDIGGTIVLTGGPDQGGDILGLTPSLHTWLESNLPNATAHVLGGRP